MIEGQKEKHVYLIKERKTMVVERTDEGILIRTTAPLNIKAVQKFIDYCKVMEITSRAQGTEEQAAELACDANIKWWSDNKHRFIK